MRKKNRLHASQYVGTRAYFVTICCDHRFPFFRDRERGTRLVDIVREVSILQNFRTYAYSVMPDHVHILSTGTRAECNLVEFVRVIKLRSSFEEKRASGRVLWQRSFYDHVLRPTDTGDGVAWYIWLNPVRKNLCDDPFEYPLSGSFAFDWKASRRPPSPWIPPWKLEGHM